MARNKKFRHKCRKRWCVKWLPRARQETTSRQSGLSPTMLGAKLTDTMLRTRKTFGPYVQASFLLMTLGPASGTVDPVAPRTRGAPTAAPAPTEAPCAPPPAACGRPQQCCAQCHHTDQL